MSAFDAATPGLEPWVWTARDISLVEFDGQLDGYESAEAQIFDGDIGNWKLTLPLDHVAAADLLTPGAGVVCRNPASAAVIFSGPVGRSDIVYASDGRDLLQLTGATDEMELASDVSWPDVTHWLNDVASNAHITGTVDARAGVAETVLLGYIRDNIGANAFHSAATTPPIDRRRGYLNVPSSLGRGTSGTYKANFDALIDIARTICRTGGITWAIRQGSSGTLDVVIRARADKSADVIFSKAEGTVNEATFSTVAPTVTQGLTVNDTGSIRTYAMSIDTAAEARWGRRFVAYGDGSTAIIADLLAAAADLVAAGIESAGAAIDQVSIPGGLRFGVDFQLGDIVSVVDASGFVIADQLRQVDYAHTKDGAPTIKPSVGFAQTDQDSAMVPIIRDLTAQVRALTRRKR